MRMFKFFFSVCFEEKKKENHHQRHQDFYGYLAPCLQLVLNYPISISNYPVSWIDSLLKKKKCWLWSAEAKEVKNPQKKKKEMNKKEASSEGLFEKKI